MSIAGIAATALMFLCIFLIPLGWPGLWLMVGIVGVGGVVGAVGWPAALVVLGIAALAELLEFFIVRAMSTRYGGSPAAFWGAIVGGTAGVFIGVPIPVIGPVIAGVLGSFLGAAAVTIHESRDIAAASRVGWGVVLARGLAAFVKIAAAFVVLVVGGTAWIVK